MRDRAQRDLRAQPLRGSPGGTFSLNLPAFDGVGMRPDSDRDSTLYTESMAEPVLRPLWKMYRHAAMEDTGDYDSLFSLNFAPRLKKNKRQTLQPRARSPPRSLPVQVVAVIRVIYGGMGDKAKGTVILAPRLGNKQPTSA